MKVYIAGPISGFVPDTTRESRKERFHKCERWINEHLPEWTVVNPLKVEACSGDECGLDDGHEWECWLRHDLKALLGCEGIVLLPSWKDSAGATLEAHVARAIMMELYNADEDGRIVL